MKKDLYRVKWTRQDDGESMTTYVLADNLLQINQEFMEIISIEFLKVEVLDD